MGSGLDHFKGNVVIERGHGAHSVFSFRTELELRWDRVRVVTLHVSPSTSLLGPFLGTGVHLGSDQGRITFLADNLPPVSKVLYNL